MRRFVLSCAAAAGLGAALSACGSLDSNTNTAPALATVVGSVTNSAKVDVASTDDVRVAVVWRGTGYGQFNVAEDLPVKPVFPADFSIALTGPPPEAAMVSEAAQQASGSAPPASASESSGAGPAAGSIPDDAGAGDAQTVQSQPILLLGTPSTISPASKFAIGTVVAYLDQNHNGKFDLVGDNATAYVDQILAANSELAIAYFEGPLPDDSTLGGAFVDGSGRKPKEGYNLVNIPICNRPTTPPISAPNPACPSAVVDAGPCAPIEWLDMKTPYPLSVATSPEVAALMCLHDEPGGASTGTGAGGPEDPQSRPAQYPDACDPDLSCASDGSHYIFSTCVTISQGLCKGTLETCTSVGFDRPTPTPSDWPCSK
jgi:hypothetical protein